MLMTRPKTSAGKTSIAMLTADSELGQLARTTFGASPQIDLRVTAGPLTSAGDQFDHEGAAVVVIDLDTSREEEFTALAALMARIGSRPPVVVITQGFDAAMARRLVQM